jgi:hypothetical protein
VGCEARKIPAAGEVFFLDFPFYRTYQDVASGRDFAARAIAAPHGNQIKFRMFS